MSLNPEETKRLQRALKVIEKLSVTAKERAVREIQKKVGNGEFDKSGYDQALHDLKMTMGDCDILLKRYAAPEPEINLDDVRDDDK